MDNRPIVIFDIDGTLANNDHREPFLRGDHKEWDKFFAAAHLDTVHEPVRKVLEWAALGGCEVVLLTGRPWRTREDTLAWLDRHGIRHDRFIMRPEGCREDDTTLKARLIEENFTPEERARILTVFEDRKRVVDNLRGHGYHVCHVAAGEF